MSSNLEEYYGIYDVHTEFIKNLVESSGTESSSSDFFSSDVNEHQQNKNNFIFANAN